MPGYYACKNERAELPPETLRRLLIYAAENKVSPVEMAVRAIQFLVYEIEDYEAISPIVFTPAIIAFEDDIHGARKKLLNN